MMPPINYIKNVLKYVKLTANLAEGIYCNKLSVYCIVLYRIISKGKYPMILKSITMIDTIMG